MNKIKYLSVLMTFFLALPYVIEARNFVGATTQKPVEGDFRANCIGSVAQKDLDINNVRCLLRAGGDMWWDGVNNARYIVPNVDPASGELEVSSLFGLLY